MCALANPHYTPEQYLALERAAEYKSEYIYGQIYAMAGVSREHSLIAGNIFGELWSQLRGSSCEIHMSDVRLKVSPTGMYTYPDLMVACDEPCFEDASVDTLLNPTVIIEVLSPSTEGYERCDKFAHYRKLPSLMEYVLVSQDKAFVEHYARHSNGDGRWVLTDVIGLAATLHLTSIGCEVVLRDVYDRVSLQEHEDIMEWG